MSLPEILQGRLSVPVVAAPMFIVSDPALVVAQCTEGIVGSVPALNARPASALNDWLAEIGESLDSHDVAHPSRPAAPYAVNLIVHRVNQRLDSDLSACVEARVPIVIISLGADEEVIAAIHGYGGLVLQDVTTNRHACKAVEKGADGLIAVAAGAGGHGGALSPFAITQEIRAWYDGLLLLSGAIATGRSILAAQVAGADLAYVGSAFIAAYEANATEAYKQLVVTSAASDILNSAYFTGMSANYLRGSVVANGLDPEALPAKPSELTMDSSLDGPQAWRDIWGAGQGVGAVTEIASVAEIVERLRHEYADAASSAERLVADLRTSLVETAGTR